MSAVMRRFSLPVSELSRLSLPINKKKEIELQKGPLSSIPEISEKDIREALLSEISLHGCYGKSAAKDMVLLDIKQTYAFYYTLETFTERRATCSVSEPFKGGVVQLEGTGESPALEDIPAVCPELFKSYVYHQEIPFTASVETCDECDGAGKYECPTCLGQGWEFCSYCRGNKYNPLAVDSYDGDCMKCQGSGERTCWVCNGDEEVGCKTCGGAGAMKSFTRLLVIWTNHVDDYVIEKGTSLRAACIRCVTGEIIYEEEAEAVMPFTHFPLSAVNAASDQLIQRQATNIKDEKILKQRQRVSLIPIAAVKYRWKDHEGLFHVYGNERNVHFPDYPQKCCCCVIL